MSTHDGDLVGRRTGMDTAMTERGAWPQDSLWLREAMAALPRDRFAPDRLWRWDGYAYVPVDRASDPQGWANELYDDVNGAAITQLDGGRPSSSLSAPGAVADMLDSLMVEPGHTVWDVGAGQGWTTALAAWRAGPGLVVATEIDEALAEFARDRLKAAGVDAEVLAADATRTGPPGGARVDRLHATYAVETVPWQWIQAVRPGGRIVYPWGRLGYVALTVDDDGGGAQGWVHGLAQFMADRRGPAQAQTGRAAYAAVRGDGEPKVRRVVERDLAPLADDWHLRFAVRVAVPDAVLLTGRDEDGVNAWVHDGDASWAELTARGDGSVILLQGGPRRIGDEVMTAWSQWEALGEPELYDYGIAVTPDGQWARLGEDGPHWPIGRQRLPAPGDDAGTGGGRSSG
ncbi:methyltransferase domain-containing protein [Kitasatospora sp. NPDC088779]|uniref:protein-L-isoaspartate O-methyltransferase family protein n=1 Tax=Kitasatospora sp. NPDC088779 TaxID=3154964 RepID=UPI00344885D5